RRGGVPPPPRESRAPTPLPRWDRWADARPPPGPPPPPQEGHAPCRQGRPLRRHNETPRQLPQAQTPAVLRGRLAPQARVEVLRVDRRLQPRQFPAQVPRPPEVVLAQRLLE